MPNKKTQPPRATRARPQKKTARPKAKVMAPVATDRKSRTMPARRVRDGVTTDKTVRTITHRELILEGTSSVAATVFTRLPLNPGLSAVLPWLSIQANSYVEYRFTRMMLEFKSRVSALTPGSTYAALLPDPLASTPPNSQSFMTIDGAADTTIDQSFNLPMTSNELSNWRLVRSGAPPVGADLRYYDAGSILLAGVTPQVGGQDVAYGHWYLAYTIEFRRAAFPPGNGSAPSTFGGYAVTAYGEEAKYGALNTMAFLAPGDNVSTRPFWCNSATMTYSTPSSGVVALNPNCNLQFGNIVIDPINAGGNNAIVLSTRAPTSWPSGDALFGSGAGMLTSTTSSGQFLDTNMMGVPPGTSFMVSVISDCSYVSNSINTSPTPAYGRLNATVSPGYRILYDNGTGSPVNGFGDPVAPVIGVSTFIAAVPTPYVDNSNTAIAYTARAQLVLKVDDPSLPCIIYLNAKFYYQNSFGSWSSYVGGLYLDIPLSTGTLPSFTSITNVEAMSPGLSALAFPTFGDSKILASCRPTVYRGGSMAVHRPLEIKLPSREAKHIVKETTESDEDLNDMPSTAPKLARSKSKPKTGVAPTLPVAPAPAVRK